MFHKVKAKIFFNCLVFNPSSSRTLSYFTFITLCNSSLPLPSVTRLQNVIILHPCPRDTGKFAAQWPNIMSAEGLKLPPESRRAASSRLEGGNFWPEGDIMWPMGGKFSSSPRAGAQNWQYHYGRANIAALCRQAFMSMMIYPIPSVRSKISQVIC